ncbi:MAG: hypothetical protein RR011_00210 [Oscillospiraceae bacterium]
MCPIVVCSLVVSSLVVCSLVVCSLVVCRGGYYPPVPPSNVCVSTDWYVRTFADLGTSASGGGRASVAACRDTSLLTDQK